MFFFLGLLLVCLVFVIALLTGQIKSMQTHISEAEAQARYTRSMQVREINRLREQHAQIDQAYWLLQKASTPPAVASQEHKIEVPEATPPLNKSSPKGVNTLKVVSVINYKGGVGKTTITSNIATYVASQGKRVLMIDLDPQTNLTFSFMASGEWEENYAKNKTLQNFFRPIISGSKKTVPLESIIIPLDVQGIKMDIISSHLELIDVDTELAACLGGANMQQLNRNFLAVHNHLRGGIQDVRDKYDLVLIDCPPNFNTVVKNALTASDFYLVPAKMDYLSTLGIEQLNRNSRKYAESHNEYVKRVGDDYQEIMPHMLGVVPSMLTLYAGVPIAANQHYIDQVKSKGYYLFPGLKENANLYAPAPQNGIPVILSNGGPSTAQGIVEELTLLSDTFIEKVGV